MAAGTAIAPASAAPRDLELPRSPELSETGRLDDRRAVVTGDRFYAVGTTSGLYPATGWHTRGEMGGFWTPPIKLLDGIWFAVEGAWLGGKVEAERFTSGWGYTRTSYERAGGVRVTRTDVVPDGVRAGLTGLTLTSKRDTTIELTMNAHSELMSVYPWGWTEPDAQTFNLEDTGAYADGSLVFREQGKPPVENAEPHDWAALVGSTLDPTGHELGPDFRGPQDPAVICPTSGSGEEQPKRCDDTAYGKGTGGQITYDVQIEGGEPTTVWFAVAGSDKGLPQARQALDTALADPAAALAEKVATRKEIAGRSQVSLPGDRLLERSVAWSKQNLASSVQEARDLELRAVAEGKSYPAPAGTLERARWFGAGWPDYPWLFGTDGEYTAFPAVAAGQFEAIKDHLRALRDVSDIVNDRSGKVVHEVMSDGSVYFGTNADPGNTDETVKFPSAIALVWRWTGDDAFRDEMYDFAVRNMHYVYEKLDTDGDGWPEGRGNVEREGMGAEKLDVTVYTIRGLRDLADMARSKGDEQTAAWATERADRLESRFEQAWWYGGSTDSYADSVDDPGDPSNDNEKIFQRHWIGVTPMEAVITRKGGPDTPLAGEKHGRLALREREQECYTDEFGLYHTGTGPTSAEGGNKGPACDDAVSSVQSERSIFSLNTAIMAVGEGNFGRMGEREQQYYTTANARIQLDPRVWEQPGMMPEIAPSPDFGANIDKKFTERSMVLQAWGTYGTLWPVVHQQLGIAPDMGRDRLTVVPRIPEGQHRISGSDVRVGDGSVDVRAVRHGRVMRTVVDRHVTADLTIGHVLPAGPEVAAVRLNGHRVRYEVVNTPRGDEVRVDAGSGSRRSVLTVRLR